MDLALSVAPRGRVVHTGWEDHAPRRAGLPTGAPTRQPDRSDSPDRGLIVPVARWLPASAQEDFCEGGEAVVADAQSIPPKRLPRTPVVADGVECGLQEQPVAVQ